ncbi:hypothetical protein [Legionella jamestowniensis]|uniref:Uncharacterized protein n=1 Tax=Legionella jamestowniensis TaxID=455 RepID=A0A0W0UTS3_9GAMM|nr:hypothetical protein [Legionella jamestowniensis]KTD11247.1 hypothetical protein Ljam_0441 [Legionella jamestowniensis]SFL70023.1 hypothetical protein SAMN02746073_1473 [Legionella jamestowniensis DSM 19215]
MDKFITLCIKLDYRYPEQNHRHPEQSEGSPADKSRSSNGEILRFAQDDGELE